MVLPHNYLDEFKKIVERDENLIPGSLSDKEAEQIIDQAATIEEIEQKRINIINMTAKGVYRHNKIKKRLGLTNS